jgi:branched-chain amino acid aminotransferase
VIHLEQETGAETTRPFDLRDRGLLLADGVFDTAMVIGGKVLFREQHAARLVADAGALGIDIDPQRVSAAIDAVIPGLAFGSVRVTVTRGAGARGLAPTGVGKPTILASVAPGDPKRVFSPVKVAPTSIRRNDTSPASRHKTLAYLDAVLAMREAAAAGADEALFLNTQGRVASCAAGNIFLLKGATLTTPALAEGAMAGVTRGWILANAHRVGLQASEATIAPEEATQADAAFVTSSLRLIAPATGVTAPRSTARPEAVTALMRLLINDLSKDGFAPPFLAPEA